MLVPESKDLHLDWGKCEQYLCFMYDYKTPKTTFPSRYRHGRFLVLSSCQNWVSTICQAIHWMPIGNDWLALQGWHTVLLSSSQKREGCVPGEMPQIEMMLKEAVDSALMLNTQGAEPTSHSSAGHLRSPNQAVHLVQGSRRINIYRVPSTS